MNIQIRLTNVDKHYGSYHALRNINLAFPQGSFTALVGPSGCGKSTLLRSIAGLETISAGTLEIAGEMMEKMPPRKRDLAMVFQSYALYPHMNVEENLTYSLRIRGVKKAQAKQAAREVAAITGLSHLLERYPRELSGGQRQRVAMSRAIIRHPKAFLFDEPLSNLDAQLRAQMRIEIKKLHQRLQTTIIYVTHDQVEAMTMADRIVVMREGHIVQIGTPFELYETPVDVFTACFIGSPSMNLMAVNEHVRQAKPELTGDLLLGVRPHDFIVSERMPEGGFDQASFVLEGEVTVVEPLGSETLVHLDMAGTSVIATAHGKFLPAVGARLLCHAAQGSLYLFDAKTEKFLRRA